jgi:hypothetical protein
MLVGTKNGTKILGTTMRTLQYCSSMSLAAAIYFCIVLGWLLRQTQLKPGILPLQVILPLTHR